MFSDRPLDPGVEVGEEVIGLLFVSRSVRLAGRVPVADLQTPVLHFPPGGWCARRGSW